MEWHEANGWPRPKIPVENTSEIKEAAIQSWLRKETCEEFHEHLGIPYKTDSQGRRMFQDAWREAVIAYEMEQGTQIADNGIFVEEKENLLYELQHGKNSIRVWGSFFSNGMLTVGFEIKRMHGSESTAACLPYWKAHDYTVGQALQMGLDWLVIFHDRPVVTQRLEESLENQMMKWYDTVVEPLKKKGLQLIWVVSHLPDPVENF